MTYTISGLDPKEFEPLLEAPDTALAAQGVIVETANAKPGFPCRVTLEDAEPGERVLLFHYESHKAITPFRSSYAIYIRKNARRAATYIDELPPSFHNRPIALRIFDFQGMLIGADMGVNSALDQKITAALRRPGASYIHAHNAMHGCFAAAIRPSAQ